MDKLYKNMYSVKSSRYSLRHLVSGKQYLVFNGPSRDHLLAFININDAIVFMDAIAAKSLDFVKEIKSVKDLKKFTDIDIDMVDTYLGINNIENDNTKKIFATFDGFVVMDVITYLVLPKNINIKTLFK